MSASRVRAAAALACRFETIPICSGGGHRNNWVLQLYGSHMSTSRIAASTSPAFPKIADVQRSRKTDSGPQFTRTKEVGVAPDQGKFRDVRNFITNRIFNGGGGRQQVPPQGAGGQPSWAQLGNRRSSGDSNHTHAEIVSNLSPAMPQANNPFIPVPMPRGGVVPLTEVHHPFGSSWLPPLALQQRSDSPPPIYSNFGNWLTPPIAHGNLPAMPVASHGYLEPGAINPAAGNPMAGISRVPLDRR